jgi:hypothetical protein
MKGRTGKRKRQSSALNLLEAQLKTGTKPEKVEGRTTNKQISHNESDTKRIKKEIEVLKKKVS